MENFTTVGLKLLINNNKRIKQISGDEEMKNLLFHRDSMAHLGKVPITLNQLEKMTLFYF